MNLASHCVSDCNKINESKKSLIIHKVERIHRPVNQPCSRRASRDNIRDSITILWLIVGIKSHPSSRNDHTWGRGSFFAKQRSSWIQMSKKKEKLPVCSHSHFLRENEVLNGCPVLQNLCPRATTIFFDFGQILCAEQHPNKSKKIVPKKWLIELLLDAIFQHLSLREYTISPNRFNALGVESRFHFVNIFIFETNITFLG